MARFRYLCIAGTFGRYHDWAHNLESPFQKTLRIAGGEPIRCEDGGLYTWDGSLNGTFWTGDKTWHRESEVVARLLVTVPIEDRIVFAHSHGGQIAILAARKIQLRTLTTIATPFRPNLKPFDAAKNIGYWQHVYDPEEDWTATAPRRAAARFGLGGLGGGGKLERRFLDDRIVNVGIPGVRHSEVFVRDLDKLLRSGVIDRAYTMGLPPCQ